MTSADCKAIAEQMMEQALGSWQVATSTSGLVPSPISMTHISSEGVRFSQNTQELRQMFTAAVAEDFARADKDTRVRYQLAVKNLGASLLMVSMRLAVAEKELASFSSFSTSPDDAIAAKKKVAGERLLALLLENEGEADCAAKGAGTYTAHNNHYGTPQFRAIDVTECANSYRKAAEDLTDSHRRGAGAKAVMTLLQTDKSKAENAQTAEGLTVGSIHRKAAIRCNKLIDDIKNIQDLDL